MVTRPGIAKETLTSSEFRPWILISGGLGYVGSRLARHIACQGIWRVRVATRQNWSVCPAWLTNGEVVTVDFDDKNSLAKACNGVAAVLHLAAPNEIQCANDPESAMVANSLHTRRLLVAARAANVSRFIRFSTIHVYGTPLNGYFDEARPTRPVHPYAIAHRSAEDWVLAAHARNEIEGLVIRLSNGFGAPVYPEIDRWSLLVNDLCRQATRTRKCVLRSPGLDWRDFIPLATIEQAVDHLLTCQRDLLGDGLFNLGGARSWQVIEMADLIAERCQALLGYLPTIERPAVNDLPAPLPLNYSIAKLRATGFSPMPDFHAEIDATLRFCATHFAADALR